MPDNGTISQFRNIHQEDIVVPSSSLKDAFSMDEDTVFSKIMQLGEHGEGQTEHYALARGEAEKRYPFLKNYRHVAITPVAQGVNKSDLGEFHRSGGLAGYSEPTITIGPGSTRQMGGVAKTIVDDMIHAVADQDPAFQKLLKQLVNNLSPKDKKLAKRRYEEDFKGYSGTNFESFDNFLNNFWAEGIVQHLLQGPGGTSEIDQIKASNPDAVPTLDAIEQLFKGDPGTEGRIRGSENFQRKPTESELSFFRGRPDVAGMAAEDDRVILNPFSKHSDVEKNAVLRNELGRIALRTGRFSRPDFAITPQQRKFFSTLNDGGSYGSIGDIRDTILSRVLSNDPSAQDFTDEQAVLAGQLDTVISAMFGDPGTKPQKGAK